MAQIKGEGEITASEEKLIVVDISCQACGWMGISEIDTILTAKLQRYDGAHGTNLRSGYFEIADIALISKHNSANPECTTPQLKGKIRK